MDTGSFTGYEPNAADTDVDTESISDLASAAGRAARAVSLFRSSAREGNDFSNRLPTTMARTGHEPFQAYSSTTGTRRHSCRQSDGTTCRRGYGKSVRRRTGGSSDTNVNANRGPDITRLRIAKMPAPTGSRGLPQTQDMGQSGRSRVRGGTRQETPGTTRGSVATDSAADRQLAREMCFNIDDRKLPSLLGADLSSGCPVLHEEILASSLQRQNKVVVGDAPVAVRSQRIAGSKESATQRNSDAILEHGRGAVSEISTSYRFAGTESSEETLVSD